MCFHHVSCRLTSLTEDCERAQRGWNNQQHSPGRRVLLACLLAIASACGAEANAPEPAAGSGGSTSPTSRAGAGASPSASAGTTSASAGTGASASGSGSVPPAAPKLAGTFSLRLVPASEATEVREAVSAQTGFLGAVADGPAPVQNAWVEAQAEAGCQLFTPKAPFCDPNCGGSAVCVEDDKCAPRPTPKSVGTVKLKGAGPSEVVMNPIGTNKNYQLPGDVELPFPPCAEGSEVTLAADGGGEFAPFELNSRCIAPLDFKGPIKLTKGTAAALRWSAPADPKLTRMQIRLDISHHGGSRGKIECDVDDDGSLDLPAAMVTKLIELGVAGFPTIILTRNASGGAAGEPKQVTLSVVESVEESVEIDGLISCTKDTQCPSPQRCQADLTCK